MEPVDNLAISSEERRETGDLDQFDPKLIPLQSNSYLGQFLVWFDVPKNLSFIFKKVSFPLLTALYSVVQDSLLTPVWPFSGRVS